MSETHENRLKRLRMRSWRRGIKEMDLILGNFSDEKLAGLNSQELDIYDDLLSENDQELYTWVTGQTEPEPRFAALIALIAAHAKALP